MTAPTLAVWDTLRTALDYYEEFTLGSEETSEPELLAEIEQASQWLQTCETDALAATEGAPR